MSSLPNVNKTAVTHAPPTTSLQRTSASGITRNNSANRAAAIGVLLDKRDNAGDQLSAAGADQRQELLVDGCVRMFGAQEQASDQDHDHQQRRHRKHGVEGERCGRRRAVVGLELVKELLAEGKGLVPKSVDSAHGPPAGRRRASSRVSHACRFEEQARCSAWPATIRARPALTKPCPKSARIR